MFAVVTNLANYEFELTLGNFRLSFLVYHLQKIVQACTEVILVSFQYSEIVGCPDSTALLNCVELLEILEWMLYRDIHLQFIPNLLDLLK